MKRMMDDGGKKSSQENKMRGSHNTFVEHMKKVAHRTDSEIAVKLSHELVFTTCRMRRSVRV